MGVLDDWNGLGKDIIALLVGTVLVIMWLASIAGVWGATRSVVKAGSTAIGGAIVLGIIASQTVLSNRVAEEIEKDHSALPAITVQVDGSGGASR
ncbi:hypothetical protein [Streptomyces formicae]|uniref:Integral membrane protein n=1 Tax=Streptomyces formicae TaxID=1616117 RepID=A0ABY3WKF3_9ACTN|nr:hypothetical protein [Streptomyces formicae]UNM11827.1 hypothetical protein J4032_09975 [Streptomyces formicae]